MKTGKTVGIVLGTLVVILLGITTLLPEEAEEARAEVFCVDQETLFEHFHDLSALAEWSMLFGTVDDDVRHFDGREGEGASLRLVDEDDRWLGIEIIETRSPEHLVYRFSTHDGLSASVQVDVETVSEGSELRIGITQHFATLWGRWAVLFVHSALEDLLREEFSGLREALDEQGHAC